MEEEDWDNLVAGDSWNKTPSLYPNNVYVWVDQAEIKELIDQYLYQFFFLLAYYYSSPSPLLYVYMPQ